MKMLRSAPDAAALRAAEPDDEVLVARCRAGDRGAFRELYLRHARYVAGAVSRWLGDDGELDDVVQDTFVRPWLVTIAIRLTHSRIVRARRRGGLLRLFGWHSPQVSDPRDRAPADELSAALARMPDALRTPWLLHHIEGERLEDVAVTCGVSLATIKRRIADCEQKLTGKLGAPPRLAGGRP